MEFVGNAKKVESATRIDELKRIVNDVVGKDNEINSLNNSELGKVSKGLLSFINSLKDVEKELGDNNLEIKNLKLNELEAMSKKLDSKINEEIKKLGKEKDEMEKLKAEVDKSTAKVN